MISLNELLFDWEPVSETAITIHPDQIQQAAELSSPIIRPTKQWSTYLHALALFGFEQWLAERDFNLSQENCTLKEPQITNILDGVSGLNIGNYKICLLVMGCSEDDVVSVPSPMLDLPDYAAHFYILVMVREELEQIDVKGLIRYDQLKAKLGSLSRQRDWTYEIPLDWFDPDPNHLLLYLRCLKSIPLDLSLNPQIKFISFNELKKKMGDLISQLSLPNCQLWQVLTWQEGVSLLSYPELLHWLYRLQSTTSSPEKIASFTAQLSQLSRNFGQSVLNVKQWLQNKVDEFSQSVSWVLEPPLVWQTGSLRSSSDTKVLILKELQEERGINIPNTVLPAYQDFSLVEYSLRLSTVSWLENEEELRSVLILSRAGSNDFLPKGLKMTISDEEKILEELLVESKSKDYYLYCPIAMSPNEQITITFTLETEESLTLPLFILITE